MSEMSDILDQTPDAETLPKDIRLTSLRVWLRKPGKSRNRWQRDDNKKSRVYWI